VALTFLLLFTLMRLLPWRLAASKVLIRLDRLAAGIAPISMGILQVWFLGFPWQWLWGFWMTLTGTVLAPINILLELNSKRQKGEKWPVWAWLLTISIVLPLSMLVYSWIRNLATQLTR